MEHEYDSTDEISRFESGFRLARAEDVIFELYRASAFVQNEAALGFERVVMNGDSRVPSTAEVRAWISSVVRGALAVQPTKLSWWDRQVVRVREWFV